MRARTQQMINVGVFLLLFILFVVLFTTDIGYSTISFVFDHRNVLYAFFGALIAPIAILKACYLIRAKGKHVVAPSGMDFFGPFQRLSFEALSMFFSLSGASTILMLTYLGRMPSEIGDWVLAFINLVMLGLIGWTAVKLSQWFNATVFKSGAKIIEKEDEMPPK